MFSAFLPHVNNKFKFNKISGVEVTEVTELLETAFYLQLCIDKNHFLNSFLKIFPFDFYQSCIASGAKLSFASIHNLRFANFRRYLINFCLWNN